MPRRTKVEPYSKDKILRVAKVIDRQAWEGNPKDNHQRKKRAYEGAKRIALTVDTSKEAD